MIRTTSSILLICFLFLFGSFSQAQENAGYVSQVIEAREQLVDELEVFAKWCTSRKLYAAADTANRQIIVLDPDHPAARKSLRYRLSKGVWIQSASYRKPSDRNKDVVDELETRREAVVGEYRRRIFKLNTKFEDQINGEAREQTLLHLLRMLPEDVEVRAALGEVLLDDQWVLKETKTALKRRELIPGRAKLCIDTAPVGDEAKPSALEESLKLGWRAIKRTPHLRVAGTGTPEEVDRVLRTTLGASEFFRTLLDTDTLPMSGFTIFLLAGTGEKRQFLDNHPRVSPSIRDYLDSLKGAGVPGTAQSVEWSNTEIERMDRSVRGTISSMMDEAFVINVNHGWAIEGIGIYLTYQLIGTRLTYYTRDGRYVEDAESAKVQKRLKRRLYTTGSLWMDEARIHFEERRPPRLNFLMGRKVDALTMQDRLWSYVFAAYLIEGCPDEVAPFLTLIGEGVQPHDACRAVFKIELPSLEQRVIRWLHETR
ncbi:MAG: hypothetical protein ACI8TQ_004064 [Planctomycetota bacterium]|jgi:hypothetical protein